MPLWLVILIWLNLARFIPDRLCQICVKFLMPAFLRRLRKSVFEEEAGQVLIEDRIIRLLTFDVNREEIIKWIP